MRSPRPFTPEELKYLSENWGKTKMAVMSAHLDRHPNVIYKKAQRVGIYTPEPVNYLTQEAKQETIRLFNFGVKDAEIAKRLGYSRSTITIYRISQGLFRHSNKPKIDLPKISSNRERLLYGVWK